MSKMYRSFIAKQCQFLTPPPYSNINCPQLIYSSSTGVTPARSSGLTNCVTLIVSSDREKYGMSRKAANLSFETVPLTSARR